MDMMGRINDGVLAKTPDGVATYVGAHVERPMEAGPLLKLDGYLTKGGKVKPLVDVELWKTVGWDGHGLPPRRLIENLCRGMDMHARIIEGLDSMPRKRISVWKALETNWLPLSWRIFRP